MANKLLGLLLFLILSACSVPPKAPTTDERTVRQGSGEIGKLYTENLPPGYTNGMEARLKAELAPTGTTEAQAAATPPDPRCTKQLEYGYALRERIDNEYWQSRRAGTFQDQREEFTARWGEEAGEWADSEGPLPKRTNTYRHGEWRCEVEQYQKFSSDEIGNPRVDLQDAIASPTPILPPVL